jgi:hypothetical protein
MSNLQPAAGEASGTRHARIGLWKEKLAGMRADLRAESPARRSPRDLLRRQSMLIDRQLKEVWAAHAMPRDVALAAASCSPAPTSTS